MKYYKITNKEEKHNGLQYKTGTIVDPLPFDPSGTCRPGGVYFSGRDILAFLDYGTWIREVTLPEDEQVYKDPGYPEKFKAHQVILGERREITAEIIKELIEEGANAKANDSFALRWAARNGHLEVVKALLPHSDAKALDSEALRYAARNGHLKVVKVLLPYSDAKAFHSEALVNAAEKGHQEVVKLLLPHSHKEVANEVLHS